MNAGRSIQEVIAEVGRQAKTKRDYISPTSLLDMAVEPQMPGSILDHIVSQAPARVTPDITQNIRLSMPSGANGPLNLGITGHAHSQMATFLKIPVQYYDRMRTEAPVLLAQNVNHWLKAQESRRMVRTLDGNARAFLSDRYRRLDNIDLATRLLPMVLNSGLPLQVASCEVTEHRLYLKFTLPTMQREVKVGDTVQAGVMISNSEVGLGSVEVQPFVLRLMCMNGATVNDFGQRRRHVGKRVTGSEEDGASEIYTDETKQADDEAFWLKCRDTVNACLNDDTFDKIVGRFRESTGEKVTGKPEAVVQELGNRIGLTQEEQDKALRHLLDDGLGLNRWAVMNSVTALANETSDYDRSSRLESLGCDVLGLLPTDWKSIATAGVN